jgi:MFS family permease
MIIAMSGYLLLDMIFLVNAFWFHELRVEYLLLECLQDLTGGTAGFFLAAYAFMVELLPPASRTWRLSVLDSFMFLGTMLGLPLGTYLQNTHSLCVVFLTGGAAMATAIAYVVFVLKESKPMVVGEVSTNAEDTPSDVVRKFPGFNRGRYSDILEVLYTSPYILFICRCICLGHSNYDVWREDCVQATTRQGPRSGHQPRPCVLSL